MKKIILFVGLFLTSFSAISDTVWLKSGDILHGDVKLVDNDKLLLETNHSGMIAIDRNKLKTFSISKPVDIKKGLFAQKQKAKQILSGQDGTIVLILPNGTTTLFNLSDKFTLFLNHKKDLLHEYLIAGQITSGAFYDKGKNKTEQMYFDGKVTARHELWRHGLTGNLRRKTENDKTKTYNYTTSYTLDRFITPSYFWSSTVSYKRDWIEDIKSKFTAGTGPGYEFWNDELGYFSLAGLVNYQHLTYRRNYSNNNPLGTVKWNYHRYFQSKTFKIFTNGSIGRSFDKSVTLDFSGVIGASYHFTKWFSVNILLTKDKSRTKDGNSTSTHYGIGLGIDW